MKSTSSLICALALLQLAVQASAVFGKSEQQCASKCDRKSLKNFGETSFP